MSSTQEPKAKTIQEDKFKVGARYIDTVLQPMLQRIIDKANSQLKPMGIRLFADIKWGFDDVTPGSDDHEGK